MPGSGSVGDQRQTIDPDKRQVAEKKTAADTKSHGFGNFDPFMTKQIGSNTALTVGRLGVGKFSQKAGPHTLLLINRWSEPACQQVIEGNLKYLRRIFLRCGHAAD